MAEFDEKLNSILSNPDAMSQIMQLAQSLGGGGEPAPAAPPPQPGPASPAGGGDLLSSLMGGGGLDPKLFSRLLPLIQELGGQRESNARNLLYALRPYLRSDRQEKVERALQLARLFHASRKRDRPQEDRPPGDRHPGDRPQEDRHPEDRPRGDRPPGDRPRGDRRREDRHPEDRPRGDRPPGGRRQAMAPGQAVRPMAGGPRMV